VVLGELYTVHVKNKTKFKTTNKVWEYFGQLCLKENDITKVVEPERDFCTLCLEKIKMKY
jgi:hypothetical protein